MASPSASAYLTRHMVRLEPSTPTPGVTDGRRTHDLDLRRVAADTRRIWHAEVDVNFVFDTLEQRRH
jgi:hypothetical protein